MPTFFLIIAVVGGVVFYLTVLNRNPGDCVFTSAPSVSRREFLQKAFGISKQDCERLHFDGRFFHHSKEIPYENYSGIRASGSKRTTISNPSLPHQTSWKYQRRDGGPDLRYRGNFKTMLSVRHFIIFEGIKSFTLHVYSYPGRSYEVDQLVEKFDAFLCGAQEQDYESEFTAFKEATEKKQQAQSKLNEIQSSLSSCDAVTAAHNKISSAIELTDELKAKVADAEFRRSLLLKDMDQLRREVQEQAQQENQAALAAQAKCEIAMNHRIITRFS
jgi:hypothetical protein